MRVVTLIFFVILAIIYIAAIPHSITMVSEIINVTGETNRIKVFLKVWLIMPWFIIRNTFNK